MAATHNLVVKTGEYDTPDGQTKARWQNIGKVFKHNDGRTSIKIDCMPVGLQDWEGWVSVFPIERNDSANNQQRRATAPHLVAQSAAAPADFDDDIPF